MAGVHRRCKGGYAVVSVVLGLGLVDPAWRRATLLRRGIADGPELLLAWAPWLLVMGVVVFWVARRAYRQDDWVAEAAAVGLAGFLLSPVSWVHHLHWIMVVVPAILGPAVARRRRPDWPRVGAAAVVVAWFVHARGSSPLARGGPS